MRENSDQEILPMCACCGEGVPLEEVDDDIICPSCMKAIRRKGVSWNRDGDGFEAKRSGRKG